MTLVPKLSSPLTKAIRTIEGITVTVINTSLVICAAIPAAGLSVKDAGILAAINTGLLVASRTAIKLMALAKGVGLPTFEPTSLGTLLPAQAIDSGKPKVAKVPKVKKTEAVEA